jgi:sugar lactone lactonase YvrE
LVKRSGIAVAADGTIFIADTQNGTVRSVGAASGSEPGVIRSVVGRWAGRQNVALAQPMGIAVDRGGDLYIADYSAGAVDVFSPATGKLSTLAQVVSPASIAVTPDGKQVFVASPATGAVFAISTSTRAIAAVSGFAPQSVSASAAEPCTSVGANVGSAAASASTASAGAAACPAGLAADARGNLFVADASGGKIIRVDAKTGKSTTIASGLSVPGEIALDAKGNLYVAEQGASRVLVLPDVTANSGNITLTAPGAFAAPCPQTTDPFTYCNMPTGGTSPNATFTLTNTSSTQITGLVITPPVPSTPPNPSATDFSVESTTCTATLPANGTCSINMAFTPQGSGARTGTLTVTDSNPGDSASYDLAGTGDDYSLQLASGQTEEVSITEGGTATFKAEVAPDSVFGQNGEMVMFQCPANLPAFSTCAFSPCPVAITPGAPVAFTVMFVTSAGIAQPTTKPCGSGAGVLPEARPTAQNPTMILRMAPARTPVAAGGRFPSLRLPWMLALVALAIFGSATLSRFGFGGGEAGGFENAGAKALLIRDAIRGPEGPRFHRGAACARGTAAGFDIRGWWRAALAGYGIRAEAGSLSRPRRVWCVFALAGLAVALLLGCGGSKTTPLPTTPVTPVGVTSMIILGNATDANGNSLGTSRSLPVILDVVQ